MPSGQSHLRKKSEVTNRRHGLPLPEIGIDKNSGEESEHADRRPGAQSLKERDLVRAEQMRARGKEREEEEEESLTSPETSIVSADGAKRINMSHRKITIAMPSRQRAATGED
jgi:hypothetical protein